MYIVYLLQVPIFIITNKYTVRDLFKTKKKMVNFFHKNVQLRYLK